MPTTARSGILSISQDLIVRSGSQDLKNKIRRTSGKRFRGACVVRVVGRSRALGWVAVVSG
eukprot:12589953-Alexandrium_andersonii.AAC.1